MIPSTNDFTSYWNFCDFSTQYIGILFGENILVYNDWVINVSKLLNDNGRIFNAINNNNKKLYVLLDNTNLYVIETTNFKTHRLICKDVKNIFSHLNGTFILKNNGDVLNDELELQNYSGLVGPAHKNIPVVANSPRTCASYACVHGYGNNRLFEFNRTNTKPSEIKQNVGKFIDMCITCEIILILNDNNTAIMCSLSGGTIENYFKFKNVNCVSAISSVSIGFIYDDNNAIVFKADDYGEINLENPISYKSNLISIPNSPYCAKFNTQNIPYYPKYFMDRFMAFVMSVRYGCNIKLPKYLCFMIANYLR